MSWRDTLIQLLIPERYCCSLCHSNAPVEEHCLKNLQKINAVRYSKHCYKKMQKLMNRLWHLIGMDKQLAQWTNSSEDLEVDLWVQFMPYGRWLLTEIITHLRCSNQYSVHTCYLSEYCHTTISLICMSTHKASAARCLSEHQAWSRQPAIWALPRFPLRRLALSVLVTIATTSYQITCTVSERTSIKGTCQCNLHGVALMLLRHYQPFGMHKETLQWKHSHVYISYS